MKKNGLFLLLAGLLTAPVGAQVTALPQAAAPRENREASRTAFMSYGREEDAVTMDYSKSSFYVSLNGPWAFRLASDAADTNPRFYGSSYRGEETEMTVPGYFAPKSRQELAGLKPGELPAANAVGQYRRQIEIPVFWLDRDIFFRAEGVQGSLTLYVNGIQAGYSEDSGSPAEFNISPYITDGMNTIGMEISQWKTGDWLENGMLNGAGIEGEVYVYSQYRIHIHDFEVGTSFDSLKNTTGVLDLAVEVVNNFNFPDSIVVYYDLRDASGKPVRYNTRETIVSGMGQRDTIRFQGKLGDVHKWSPDRPYLYELVLRIRYQGRFTEYIPYKIGFRDLKIEAGRYLLNGVPLELKTKDFTWEGTAREDAALRAALEQVKQEGYNAVRCGYHPRKTRLYELCDELGLLIVDQTAIDTSLTGQDRGVGGTLANDPAWAEAYCRRTENMWRSNRNRTAIVVYSLGAGPGVGYNTYRSYLFMKELEPVRPVVYRPAETLWATDPQTWSGDF
ncbi:MAG: hypothetical protein LUD68_07955 [Rikenellaceae bacterium]|nr:hypothetical protein [Rikenellaceae bacterium]